MKTKPLPQRMPAAPPLNGAARRRSSGAKFNFTKPPVAMVMPALPRQAGPFPEPPLLTVSQVARRLNVSRCHVSQLIEARSLPAINVGTGAYKFWRIPVAAFEADRKSVV